MSVLRCLWHGMQLRLKRILKEIPVNDLLAPSSSNSISKKNNSIVKAALFQFIADTKRNL